ncbi:Aldo/keto reductase [Imleria badia]|nr:Aldo/keto reductase [Imleria badia]
MCAVTLSRLGQHRILAPCAGLYVSPLQLGSTGDGENQNSGRRDTIERDVAFELLDAFYEAGGNFIDTAHNCHGGLSEEWIGEWAEQRCVRDELVIATKYSANLKRHDKQNTQFNGNNVKSIVLSLEASLKALRTSYIDILYVHFWDWSSPVEEVMNALHNLVAARKVFYLGLSNSPVWICSKANMYARVHGKTPFAIYQGSWDVMDHTFLRDIVPMAQVEVEGLGDAEDERCCYSGKRVILDSHKDLMKKKLSRALDKVAKEVGVEHISTVAIAYILHKTPHVFPLIGGSKVEQLFAHIKGLEICLSLEQISCIESAVVYEPAHPLDRCHSLAF